MNNSHIAAMEKRIRENAKNGPKLFTIYRFVCDAVPLLDNSGALRQTSFGELVNSLDFW